MASSEERSALSEQDLLLALLAVQVGAVAPDQLLSCLQPRSDLGLAQRLVARGLLSSAQRHTLEAMRDEALLANDEDPVRALASLSAQAQETFGLSLPGSAAQTGREETLPCAAEAEQALQATSEHPGRYSYRDPQGDWVDKNGAELGRGGIGRVLLALDEHLDRQVALKELLPHYQGPGSSGSGGSHRATLSTVVRRFLQEARITGQLEHPSIVPVYELGQRADGTLYYTMKLVKGRTLAEALKDCAGLHERLALLDRFVDLCQAIAYAHSRGVVHRDIKPQNVMLGEFGETVVLDWGLAKLLGQAEEEGPTGGGSQSLTGSGSGTVAGRALGTPRYMSPEQAAGRLEEMDHQSDVWSLGVVLYEMLTGQPPFRGNDIVEILQQVRHGSLTPVRSICPEAPAELASVCDMALQRDRRRRYASARALLEDVRAFQLGGRVGAYDYSSWELVRRFVARQAVPVSIGTVALVLLLVLGVVAFVRVRAERDQTREAEKVARLGWAESLRVGSRSALEGGQYLEARAKIRPSLEMEDALLSRFHWLGLHHSSILWRQDLVTWAYDVAFSPDGQQLAVASAARCIYLFDLRTKATRVLRGFDDQTFSVSYSPCGRYLASGTFAGAVAVRDLEQDSQRALDGHGQPVTALAFDAQSARLATGAMDGTMLIHDLATGEVVARADELGATVASLVFEPGGERLLAASPEPKLLIWDPQQAPELRRFANPDMESASSRALVSQDGRWVAWGAHDGRIWTWRVDSAEEPRLLATHQKRVGAMDFIPGSHTLVAGSDDGLIRAWDVSSGAQVFELREHACTSQELGIGPHGRSLALTSSEAEALFLLRLPEGPHASAPDGDPTLDDQRTWKLGLGAHLEQASGHDGGLYGLVFDRQAETLFTGGLDGTIRVWDVTTGAQQEVRQAHDKGVYGLDLNPDGTVLASVSYDRSAAVWEARTGARQLLLPNHPHGLYACSFDPGGNVLATAGMDLGLHLWDWRTGQKLRTLTGHDAYLWDVTWHPAGQLVAAAERSGAIHIWDWRSGDRKLLLEGHTGPAIGLSFAPDGRQLASAGVDGTARIWDLASGQGRTVAQVEGRAYWISLDLTGTRLGIPTSEGFARILDLRSGSSVDQHGHAGEVNSIAFSTDGRLAATAGDDGTVRVWDAQSGRPAWRGPFLHGSLVYTHRGWRELAEGRFKAHPASTQWKRAIEERAASAAMAPDGRHLCLQSFDGNLEIWDVAQDQVLLRSEQASTEQILAVVGGCVTLGQGVAQLHRADSTVKRLGDGVGAMAWDGDQLLLAEARQVRTLDSAGQPQGSLPGMPGACALARLDEHLALGFPEGSIVLRALEEGGDDVQLKELPSSPVALLLAGPRKTLVAGFANGVLGMWDSGDGTPLERVKLHGRIAGIQLADDHLLALTDLGELIAADLSPLRIDHCELLQQVWRTVPVVWERGEAELREAPQDHECAVGGAR